MLCNGEQLFEEFVVGQNKKTKLTECPF